MRQKLKYLSFIILLAIVFPPLAAQHTGALGYKVATGISYGTGDYAPFWFTANKHGIVSADNSSGYLQAGVKYSGKLNKNLSYRAELNLVTAYNHTAPFFIQQACADLNYRMFGLTVGSKEYAMNLKNSLLSSGGMTWSGNSRPIPQVRISIPEYHPLFEKNKWVQFKAHLSYGRFTDDHFQKDFTNKASLYNTDVFYHSKALFVKLENEKIPFVFEGGLEMDAQFGGKAYYPDGKVNKNPTKFMDFVRVLIPMSGDETSTVGEQVNIYGNHLGSWHFSFKYKFKDWNIRAYYEHFFEDHSQMFMEYGFWKDGLIGIEVNLPENRWVKTFLYEYIGTKDQTGPFLHDSTEKIPDQISGNDNYYNHYFYSGWEHWGMGVGHPFLISPLYNSNGNLRFRSNRIKAHHIGFSGTPHSEISYRILFSYARHWGTYYNPLPEIQRNVNGLAELTYRPVKLPQWAFTLSGAMDKGKILGSSTGGMLTIQFSY